MINQYYGWSFTNPTINNESSIKRNDKSELMLVGY
jgi:hypothetical protein